MRCPKDNCDFKTHDQREMLNHLPTHEKITTNMHEYPYHVEVYTNRHGKWQITVGAKADSKQEVMDGVMCLYEAMVERAKEEGFEVVSE